MNSDTDFVGGRRGIERDHWSGSLLAGKLVNCVMRDGKKSVASLLVRGAVEHAARVLGRQVGDEILAEAIENLKPQIEVRSKRVGGATYQVPTQVGGKRRQMLAVRWLLEAARSRSGKGMATRLGEEIVNAIRREGVAYTKRENVHKMADANKAFAHFG